MMPVPERKYRVPELKIGGTSFLVPDYYVPAVRKCANFLDDISLLLLEGGTEKAAPISRKDIDELVQIAEGENITWNIHLPTTGSFLDKEERGKYLFLDQVRRAIDLTLPLMPHTWVLHIVPPEEECPLWSKEMCIMPPFSEIRAERVSVALEKIIKELPSPQHLALENLEGQSFDFLTVFLERFSCSRCFDIGHVWKDGLNPECLYDQWLSEVRMCHLHGLGTRDHQSLSHMPETFIDAVLHPLWQKKFAGIITLEVFSMEDFTTSHTTMINSYERYVSSV